MVWDIIVANHHKWLTKTVRHFHWFNQEHVRAFTKDTHAVARDVIKLPNFCVTLILVVHFTATGVISITAYSHWRNIKACSLRVTLIVLYISDRAADTLRYPLDVFHGCCIWVHKNIINRNTLSERAVLTNNSVRMPDAIRVCFRNLRFTFYFFLNKTVTNFNPTMTKRQHVFYGTAELGTNILMFPPIVHNRFSDNSLSSEL